MQNITCGITSVIIGREFALNPLLNYFKNVEIPIGLDVNLYLVLGCDSDFEIKLKDKIKEFKLDIKYKNIVFVPGNLKCHSNLDWNEWEDYTRQKDPDTKHRAALDNIEIGLESAKHETYIHFVDDDTIPPINALTDLLKSYQNIDNCGLASGIYFNKVWVEPTIAVGATEAIRRIVCSLKKETWLGCAIDDLGVENYNDVGFVGNGCMLISGEDAAKILPLSEFREQSDDIAPPDFIICRRIRRLNKIISMVPTVIAEHLDQLGNPIGLSKEYLENVKNSTGSLRFLVTHYDKYLNYKALSQQYDKILIIYHTEIHRKLPEYLNNLNNIQIIERSIKKTCETFSDYKNYEKYEGVSMKHAVMAEMHEFIKDEFNYIAYYHDPINNAIFKIPLLDSRNLKKLLNKKI